GLANDRDFEVEGFARLETLSLLGRWGRLEEADAELVRAEEDARLSGSALLTNYAAYHRGWIASLRTDRDAALSAFRKLESVVVPDGDAGLQQMLLNALGAEEWQRGRIEEAIRYYRRAAALADAAGDFYGEASILANIHLARQKHAPEDEGPDFTEALRLAGESGNRKVSGQLLFFAAQNTRKSPPEVLELLDRAIEEIEPSGDPIQLGFVLRYKAHMIAYAYPSRRGEAERILDRSLTLARQTGQPEQEARVGIQRATILMDAGERMRSANEWLAVLDTIEKVRDQQMDEGTRAGFQSTWAFLYYRVAAYFLRQPGPGAAPEDVDAALRVIERMRARVLIETLDVSGAPTGGVPSTLQERRAAVLKVIATIQRTLLGPTLAGRERRRALSELERLEASEYTLRQDLSRADPGFGSLRAPVIPTVARLQEALRENEALVSFQSNLDARRRGWALAITRDSARTWELPDRAELTGEISLFLGLLARRDDSEGAGAASLYRDLFAEGLRGLPERITHLIVVPDGPLHKLPIDALRTEAEGLPLAARFEISIAPSCSTWLRWSGAPAVTAASPLLALADPALDAGPSAPAAYRAATVASGLRLGSLPRARDEARSLAGSLGAGSRIALGADATERFMKTVDLRSFRMLHIAAHAVVDEAHPERSAVLLAPGADDEDGLLQIREIVGLDLKGRLIFLSSCDSASGTVVEGEGVMGLARAFFQAGAVGVVGSLWPIRDDEAALMVDAMATHLGRGASIASALASARRDRLKAGAPAADWAALVVLGDGNFVPLPGGRRAIQPGVLFAAIGAAIAAVAGALLLRRGRTRRAPRPA
ncbi:MAG TPA: CHAT domain-containing protein, partial [Verrucomicrobiae bacterium]|nr:CHAT domain-containing protein [Verrucomicrobiae bacterium]